MKLPNRLLLNPSKDGENTKESIELQCRVFFDPSGSRREPVLWTNLVGGLMYPEALILFTERQLSEMLNGGVGESN